MKKIILLSLVTFSLLKGFAQNAAINNTGAAPDTKAMLDISSNTIGILIPRMLQTERDAISTPTHGLMIFNTDTNSFQFYNGVAWLNISHSGIINGTDNKVAKFTGSRGLAPGLITDDGNGVAINNTSSIANASSLYLTWQAPPGAY